MKERLEEEVVLVAKAKGISLHTAILEPGKNGKGAGYTKSGALPCAILRCRTWITTAIQKLICCAAVWWKWEKPLASPPYNAFAYHVIKALEEKMTVYLIMNRGRDACHGTFVREKLIYKERGKKRNGKEPKPFLKRRA